MADKTKFLKDKNVKKKKIIRSDIQFIFFVIAVLVTINASLVDVGQGISWISSGYIHYVCPICGVTTIYQVIASSSSVMTKLLNPVTAVIGVSVIVAILFGPIFCGWICPFGGFQDFVAKVFGKRIFKKKYNHYVNEKLDYVLRGNRYIVLIVVIYMTAKSAVTILENINPYHALLNLFIGEFAPIGLVVLAVIIIASLFIHRPWCKYFCPYGAFLGLFNLLRINSIVRDDKKCVQCKKCHKECPMNIKVNEKEIVRDLQCISCMECTSANSCPIEDTIKFKSTVGLKDSIKLNSKVFGIITITMFFLSLYTFSLYNKTATVKTTTVATTTTESTNSTTDASSTSSSTETTSDSSSSKAGESSSSTEASSTSSSTETTKDSSSSKAGESGSSTDASSVSTSNEVTATSTTLSGNYTSGTYTGEGKGYNSGLIVEVTIADNAITNIDIVSNNETLGYFESAYNTIPNEIIEAQSTDVDVVSGATKSSNGIINAVNNALEQAAN